MDDILGERGGVWLFIRILGLGRGIVEVFSEPCGLSFVFSPEELAMV